MQYDFHTVPDRRGTGASKWLGMLSSQNDFDKDVVPMSIADMEFFLAPEIMEGLKTYLGEAVLGYSTSYPLQKQAVCQWIKRKHHYEVDPEWIVSTPGVVNAFTAAIRAFSKENDGVILFKPIYHPMSHAIISSNRKEVNVPLLNDNCEYTIDFESFEREASKPENKILLFCSPHNPTGRVWTKEELEKLTKIALKNDLLIISDEIWNDVVFPGFIHTMTASLSEDIEDITITCTAPSKTFNIAGLMCSNIIISNDNLRKKFKEELDYMENSTVNALGYKACEIAYTKAEQWLNEVLKVISENHRICEEFFDKYNFPYTKKEGTYLFWVDMNSLGLNKEELQNMLENEAHFISTQGYVFGKEGEGYERINLALPTEALKTQLKRLEKILEDRMK